MKRISIAEQTLKKQIDALYARREVMTREIEKLVAEDRVYKSMILDLETEQSRLQAQRIAASERVNP